MVPIAVVLLLRLLPLPTTSSASVLESASSSAVPPTDIADSWWRTDRGNRRVGLGPIYSGPSSDGGGGASIVPSDAEDIVPPSGGKGAPNSSAHGGSDDGAGRAGWFGNRGGPSSWLLFAARGDTNGEESEDVGDVNVREYEEGMCVAPDHLHPEWVEMQGGRGVCQANLEKMDEVKGDEGGGGDDIVRDGAAAGDADAPADIIESGGSSSSSIESVYADDARDDMEYAATSTVSDPSISGNGSSSSGGGNGGTGYDSAPVEFNQHLLVEVDVAIVVPWKRNVDYDISAPASAHMFGVAIKNGAGGGGVGSGSNTIGGSSARGATWSGDHSSSGGGSRSNGSGSGWAVTLEEVVFTHRQGGGQLDRMERHLLFAGGYSGSAGSATASFLIPMEALHRRAMVGNEADNGHEPIDHIRELVLRASLVELIPSAKDDAIHRRVVMARLVPVPLTEDGLLNPVVSVDLNGTASAPPVRIGDGLMTPNSTSSWGSMMITAVAAVALGVVMALCFLHFYPADVDEYEYDYQQQQEMMEEEHIHYMYTYAHHNDNVAGTEMMEETAAMELEGGEEGGMLIGDAADATTSQAGEDEREEEGEDSDGMVPPPDVRRKMTAIDMVGALCTPVKTPVKEQPVTSGLGKVMPSGGSPRQHDGTVDDAMPLPDDGSVQQPQEEQPLLDRGVNDTSGAALLETGGIGELNPGSGGQRAASAEEQYRPSSDGFGLTLGQRSFCSDSSAASASSIETHLHANWKQSQSLSQAEKDPAPTAETCTVLRSNTSIVASSPTRSTSSSIAGNMTTIGNAATERQNRQPRRRPRQLPSQNAPLFVEKWSPKHRKVEVKPLPAVGASRRLKKEEKKWDDSRYKFGATASAGGSLASSKDRSASTNKAPSIAKSDSSKSSSKRKREKAMPLASISVPSDVNAKKQRKSA